jgi:hypothetical protein
VRHFPVVGEKRSAALASRRGMRCAGPEEKEARSGDNLPWTCADHLPGGMLTCKPQDTARQDEAISEAGQSSNASAALHTARCGPQLISQLQVVLDREQEIAKEALKTGDKVRPAPVRAELPHTPSVG